MRRRLKLLPLLLGMMSSPAWAQSQKWEYTNCADEYAEFCTILVIGNLKSSIGERSETIIPLSPSEERLENLLQDVPGLQQFRRSDARSANPTSQGVTLRGLGGNASSRAMLFLDDVPQADPFGGWVSWPGYDALNLASIRVRKGGGQPSAGPGALAGIIELDSVQNRDATGLSLDYGSRNSVEGRGRFARRLGNGSISIGASYARGDGFIPIIEGQRGAVDRQAGYEQAALTVRAVAPLTDSIEFQANMRAFTDNRERGLDFSDNANSGVDASLRLVDRDGDWQWSGTAYLQLREFSSEFGSVSTDRSIVTPTLDQFATPSAGSGLRFELRPPVGEKAQLRIGSEWRRTNGRTQEWFTYVAGQPTRLRTAGGQTDSYGGFAEASFEATNRLTLTAGGRIDQWQIADGFRREINSDGSLRSDDRFADRSGTQWTGRAGFGWDIVDNFNLRGAAYRGWRLPTLNELYRPFRAGADATAANENLQPEKLTGAEISFGFDDHHVKVDATAFWNRLDDAIANVSLGAGPGNFPGIGFVAAGGIYRLRQNLDAIVSKGLEIDASLALTPQFSVKIGYAFVDAHVEGSGSAAALDGLRPAQVPRHFGNATLVYSGDAFSADATLRYIGAQYEDDANSRNLADAITADLRLAYRVTANMGLEVRAENLFDARVEAAISSTGVIERASPRTLWLGVRWNFD